MFEYKNSFGSFHRDGGLPAVESLNGTKEWWVNGKKHREDDLPAVEYYNGTKEWWVNGQLHREVGPAIKYAGGSEQWFINGKHHREGGLPAVDGLHGYKKWYVNGQELSCEKGLAYLTFCQKIQGKKQVRAQKKLYFWWIQICYSLEHKSGCGQRMALKNLEVFESMMNQRE